MRRATGVRFDVSRFGHQAEREQRLVTHVGSRVIQKVLNRVANRFSPCRISGPEYRLRQPIMVIALVGLRDCVLKLIERPSGIEVEQTSDGKDGTVSTRCSASISSAL